MCNSYEQLIDILSILRSCLSFKSHINFIKIKIING